MLRLLSILLLLAYTPIQAVGINLQLHYCGGDISGISLVESDKSCCGAEAQDNGCCHTDKVYIKDTTAHALFSITTQQNQQSLFLIPTTAFCGSLHLYCPVWQTAIEAASPPLPFLPHWLAYGALRL